MKKIFSTLFILLFFSARVSADVTINVNTSSTVGTQNGTTCTAGNSGTAAYARLLDAVNALPSTFTDNYIINICNDPGSPEDTASIASTPWDQDTSTFRLTVRTNAANRAVSPMDTSRYVLHCTNAATGCLYNNLPNKITIDGLQIWCTETNAAGSVCLKGSNANQSNSGNVSVILSNNVVKGETISVQGSTIGIESRYPCSGSCLDPVNDPLSPGVNYVVNNIIYGFRVCEDNDWAGSKIANNTAVDCEFVYSNTNVGTFKNNYSFVRVGGNAWAGTFPGATNNGANDGSAPGTSTRNCTPTWADWQLGDYHLAAGDTCLTAQGATDPTGSGLFDADFDGITRTGTWAIGADQYAVTVTLTGTTISSITEADVVAGGKTTIATIAGERWQPTTRASIQYIGGQVGGFVGTTSSTDINFNLTNGVAGVPAAGDLVVVTFCTAATTVRVLSVTNTAGTAYGNTVAAIYADDTFDTNMTSWYRIMPGTPETAVRFAGGTIATTDAGAYSIHVYRGFDSGTPLDVTGVTASGINARTPDPGSITPSTTGAWLQVSGCGASASPSNYATTTTQDQRTANATDTNSIQIGDGFYVWTSGAYNPPIFTGGGTTTNDSWGAVTLAIRPLVTTPFTDQRSALQTGFDSNLAEATGWDATVKTSVVAGNAVRTSSNIATITWQAVGTYNITATETITGTIPAAIIPTNGVITASPTFTVTATGASGCQGRFSMLGVSSCVKPSPIQFK